MGVHDPAIDAERRPTWRFQHVDIDGPFGWRNVDAVTMVRIFAALKSYETMRWPDIDRRRSCHEMPVSAICPTARKRLEEIQRDDLDPLYQLQLDGKGRIWGWRDRNILHLIWWDPNHEVYPVEKRNT